MGPGGEREVAHDRDGVAPELLEPAVRVAGGLRPYAVRAVAGLVVVEDRADSLRGEGVGDLAQQVAPRRAARQDAVERGARRGRMLVGPRRREDDVPRAGVPELRDEPRHVERVDGLLEVAAPPVLVGGARRPVHADPERSREPVGRRARVAVRRVRRAERLRDAPPERLAEDRPLRRAVDERLRVDPLQRLAGREIDRAADPRSGAQSMNASGSILARASQGEKSTVPRMPEQRLNASVSIRSRREPGAKERPVRPAHP